MTCTLWLLVLWTARCWTVFFLYAIKTQNFIFLSIMCYFFQLHWNIILLRSLLWLIGSWAHLFAVSFYFRKCTAAPCSFYTFFSVDHETCKMWKCSDSYNKPIIAYERFAAREKHTHFCKSEVSVMCLVS